MNKPQENLEYKKGYGANFANLRKKEFNGEKNFTVRELGNELGISYTTISLIEKEERFPTVAHVKAYKDFFNVSLDYLVGETNVIQPSLQAVCEYTGLSEKAINVLTAFKELNEYYLANMSRLCGKDHQPKFTLVDTMSFIIEEFGKRADYVESTTNALNEDNSKIDFDNELNDLNDEFYEKFPQASKWLEGKGVIYSRRDNFNFMVQEVKDNYSRIGENVLTIHNPTEIQKILYPSGLNLPSCCNVYRTLEREKELYEYRKSREKIVSTVTDEDLTNFRSEHKEYANESDEIILDIIVEDRLKLEKK